MKMNIPFSLEIVIEFPHCIDWNTIPNENILEVPRSLLIDYAEKMSMKQLFAVYDDFLNSREGVTENETEHIYETVIEKIEHQKSIPSLSSNSHNLYIADGSVKLIKRMFHLMDNIPHHMSLNVVKTKKFLDAGVAADTTHEDHPRNTALMNAAHKGLHAVMKLLVASGADVNYEDERGHTALVYAICNNRKNTVTQLIQMKADPNCVVQTEYGKNVPCLCVAIKSRKTDIVDTLLKFKADPYKSDSRGYNAYNYAEQGDARFIESLVLGYM